MNKIPSIYVLYSGQLYGTERMTIKIAKGLSPEYWSIIFAPPGLILTEAAKKGIFTQCFGRYWDLACFLIAYLAQYQQLIFFTTNVSQSLLIVLCNLLFRRQIVHVHIVHGGAEEYLSYGRKSLLNNLPVQLIAVSPYVQKRLEIHGVNTQKIKTIENFLLASEIENLPQRKSFTQPGINKIVIVSRLDPIKRIDLLFDTLDLFPSLQELEFDIFGLGKNMAKIQSRAIKKYPQAILKGFEPQILQLMVNYDLLLHLCPVEPFGLAVIEAMAVGLPVLVPNQGGTKTLVKNGVSGFQFNANDCQDLGRCLLRLQQTSPELLNEVVKNAQKTLKRKYSEQQGISAYRQLLSQHLNFQP